MKILSHCVARILNGNTNQRKCNIQFEKFPEGCCFFLSALSAEREKRKITLRPQ
jgi:hypothetical protein